MKLKTIDVNGATYAAVTDGKPVFVDDAGKEIPFDVAHTTATISRLNGEAKGHRERAEAAEGKLKLFEGIEDAEGARKALETVKNLSAGDLVKADKVEEIKREARAAAEKQVADAAKASAEEIKRLTGERDAFQGQLYTEKVGGAFSRSKFITDKVAVPVDMVQAMFGQRFKVEDNRIVGYDAAGNKLYSRAKPGELAEFDEALETMVDSYAHRDSILKGANQSGSGARPGSGGGSGGKTITRAQFEALPPMQKHSTISSGVTVVD